jgi:hypothetical protein
MITSRRILLRMRNVSDKSCREKQNTHFMFNNIFFFKNRAVYEIMRKIRSSQTAHRWQYNMAHALCIPDNWGNNRHTLRIFNTYCFSTATMVTRTRLNVTFVRTLSVLLLSYSALPSMCRLTGSLHLPTSSECITNNRHYHISTGVAAFLHSITIYLYSRPLASKLCYG